MFKPVALICSDLHLTSTPPLARSKETEWWNYLKSVLQQLKKWRKKYNVPILCAGDVFDSWKATPELINFSIEHLPDIYAIPGQHDLPYHDLLQIQKSAFWTLVEAGRINKDFLKQGIMELDENIIVEGFAYGEPISHRNPKKNKEKKIAMAHQYVWTSGHGYSHAPIEGFLSHKKYEDWDVVIFGDNHKAFEHQAGKTLVWNNGCLFRRKSDEISYKPRFGLLYDSMEIESIPLNLDGEMIEHVGADDVAPEVNEDLRLFVKELIKLDKIQINFSTAIRIILQKKKISREAEKFILEALEKKR